MLKGGGGSDRLAASVVSRSLTGHGAKDARMTRDDKLVLTPLKYFQDRVGREGQTPAAEPGSAASVCCRGRYYILGAPNICLTLCADSTGAVYAQIHGRASGKDLGFFCIFWLGNVRLNVNVSQLACHWGGTTPELLLKLMIALKTVFSTFAAQNCRPQNVPPSEK